MEKEKELTMEELMDFINSQEGDFFISVNFAEGGGNDGQAGCDCNTTMQR